jgi:hypothetical protein
MDHPNDGGAGAPGQLVVGVQTAELGSLIGTYHIVVKRDVVVLKDELRVLQPGQSEAFVEPIEADGAVGSVVEAHVDGFAPGSPITDVPVISRVATTKIVAGGKKLLRLRIDSQCASLPNPSGGPRLGMTCAAPLTCASGACIAAEVGENDLEDYVDGWENAPPPDACRPAKPGPPEVILGTGQTDYSPLNDGQTLQMEQGPQGGHHIWMAVRMRNLRQSGSTTTVSGVVSDGPSPVAPLAVVFTFDPDEGAYCKVYGLRFQLDASGLAADGSPIPAPDYHVFLNKTIAVTAEVVDSTGARASATRTVHLADKILCADGTEACNTP